jgi:hypothetical protein
VFRLAPFIALLLASCSRQVATSPDCLALAAPKAVLERCFGGDLEHGKYVGDLKCWPFAPSERMKGFWLVDLEASEFYPSLRALNDNYSRGPNEWKPQVWLDSDLLDQPVLRAASQGAGRRVYSVDFEGRRSLCGSFGHFGIFPKEVIAERFYAIRLLPQA